MPDSAHRVRLEGIDLTAAFPTLRLFESFRMALQPTKLLLGMLLLMLVYFGGVTLDFIWGEQVPEDGPMYVMNFEEPFESYRVFDQIVLRELHAFASLINAATHLDLGVGDLADGRGQGVLGAMWSMAVVTPGWVWTHHPGFFLIFSGYTLVVFMVLGGAISRLAVMQACADASDGLFETASFTAPRAGWFIVAPLIPLGVAGVVWLIQATIGVVLFNVPGLNILGALGFGLMILLGFVAACLMIFSALGVGMLPSALAVEGTDAFDAVSRVCTFLIYRPIRYLLLIAISLVFGALMYLVVGTIMYFAFWFTTRAVGAWVGGFDQLVAVQEFGRMPYRVEAEGLSTMDKGTAWLLLVWSRLWFGLSLAFVISFFFSAQTWIYLLLRRDVDGTVFEDCYIEAAGPAEEQAAADVVADKIETAGDAGGDGSGRDDENRTDAAS
ncbi:MAG: hypothetical protein AAF333_17620 [Planctomycetota bacterium]